MRIGINFQTMDTCLSGVDYYTIGLINALTNIDHRNHYLVFTNQPAVSNKLIKPAENLYIRKFSHLKTRLTRIRWEHLYLPQIAKKENLDILHCPAYICPFFSANLPFIVTIHDAIALEHPELCKISNALYYKIFLKNTAKKAAKIITVSKDAAKQINRNLKIEKSKLKIIYPGIDRIFKQNRNRKTEDKIKLKLQLPDQYILFVGNLEPKKNLTELLHTSQILKKMNLPHKLIIVGSRTWKSKKILNQLRNHASSNNVILLGYLKRDELSCVYKLADIYISLSLTEGLCFPALEAMASGTPVVATNVGILKEINQQAFCSVKTNEIEQTAKTIRDLLKNDYLKRKQINIAAEESKKFKWITAARKVLAIYREVSQCYEYK